MLGHLSPTTDSLRVAIVGLGPKGLFALERLLDHASPGRPGIPIEIDAFEPHPVPGAGSVYDPGQPAYLRMNFAAGLLDMWWPGGTAVPPSDQRSFVSWSRAHGAAWHPDDYPPRSAVGRYLSDGLAALLAHAPPHVVVTIRSTRVRAIRRSGENWEVAADGPAGRYDEVLIATGHDPSWPGALSNGWTGPAPLVPAVFPVERRLSTDQVPPGATVAIRGFALSFIDAALATTEGRGGSFEPWPDAKRDRSEIGGSSPLGATRLRYRPGGAEPAAILPFSRTGRPMLAKPAPGLGTPGLDAIARRGRRRIAALGGVVRLRRDLLPILGDAARANLLARSADARPLATVAAWLERAVAAGPDAPDEAPVEALGRSLAVRGTGLEWALGQTWRSLYPAVVARLGDDRLATADWPGFRNLAAELERLSFGPPPVNAAKLLALVDAGLVDLTHVRGRLATVGGRTVLRSAHGDRPIDVVIDAVLPAPGAGPGQNPLLDRLIADGHARVAPGRRGIDVGPDGSCRGIDGSPTPGLAAIGRPTEDAVIGNDTLSRTLHPVSDLWARRIIERSRVLEPAGR